MPLASTTLDYISADILPLAERTEIYHSHPAVKELSKQGCKASVTDLEIRHFIYITATWTLTLNKTSSFDS